MRCLVVTVCIITTCQLFGKRPTSVSGTHQNFRNIIEAFCYNYSSLGKTLIVLESGQAIISLTERLPAARIADLLADKVNLSTDDRGLVMSAIPGDEPYYNQFEISGGKVQVHPQRYLGDDFPTGGIGSQPSFGGTIRKKRLQLQQEFDRKKFTMGAISDQLKISRATLHAWETGRGFPNENRMQELADILSLEISELQRLRADGKKDTVAKEAINYLERQIREEKITLKEITTLKTFKEYLKAGMDLETELAEHLLGANKGTRFKRYYAGEVMPTRRTVVKLANLLDIDAGLLWKALIRDKLANKFDRYNLVEHRHKFTRPTIYEAFKKLTVTDTPPPKQMLDVDKEMENFEISFFDILGYDQPFSSLLSEFLAIDDDNSTESAIELFAYRSGISEEKLSNFVNRLSLPNSQELEVIANELLIETEDLRVSVQLEKFLDFCLEHLQAGGELTSTDSILPEEIKEILKQRTSKG